MPALSNADSPTRRVRAIANACLALGLLLYLFVTPSSPALRNALHAVVGFTLGFSVAVNVHLLWRARRKRQNQA